MEFLKRKHIFKSFSLSKGQATVEYILLLVVVVTIALVIGGPLGRHLKNFSGAMIGPGGYYSCLTKQGLLPGANSASACGSSLAIGTLSLSTIEGGGSGEGSGGGPGGGSSGKDSSDGDNSLKEANSGDKKSKKRKSSRHRSRNRASLGSEGGGGQGFLPNNAQRQATFLSDSKDKNSKKNKQKKSNRHRAGEDGLTGNQFKKAKNKQKRKRKVRISRGEAYLGDQIYFVEEEEKNSQPVFQVTEEGKKRNANLAEEKKKTSRIQNAKTTDEGQLKEENTGLNFNGFLKYLVIAIIIIVILMIVFSQIMEYQSKD